MANSLSPLNPENWKPMVQDFLNNMLVSRRVANTAFKAQLVNGDTINWPELSDVRVQTYTVGTDLTIDDTDGTQSAMSIDQSRAATFKVDPTETRQAMDKQWAAKMARQSAFQLSNDIDQKVLKEGIDNATNTVAGGTFSSSTIYSKLTDVMATLDRENATDRAMFAVMDPERIALLAQSEVANGFNLADNALANGFVGNSQAGFKIFKSNNLPTSVTLTLDTIPTATDTFTIFGVTFTWVASGAAAAAGEISVGANVAASKVNYLLAIAGTATGSAATYIDLSKANRRKLQNAGVSAAAFSGDDSVMTAFGKIGASETYTPATNVYGTETGSLLCGSMGAVSLGLQMQPNLFIRQEPKQLVDNYITHTLYGKKVFSRDAKRLVNLTLNI